MAVHTSSTVLPLHQSQCVLTLTRMWEGRKVNAVCELAEHTCSQLAGSDLTCQGLLEETGPLQTLALSEAAC